MMPLLQSNIDTSCETPTIYELHNFVGTFLLKRLRETDESSTYASQLVSVDTSEDYGWAESAILDTHARLIQSKCFLASVDWPNEIPILSAANDESLRQLRSSLLVKPTGESQIEIGLHGDVTTKPQRDQIVRSIADAYRKKISETRTAAAQKVIRLLLKSHAETCEEREVAEAEHRRLAQNDVTNKKEASESLARLRRLNELLDKLSDQLLEYGVPAIAGSLELSLERTRRAVAVVSRDPCQLDQSPTAGSHRVSANRERRTQRKVRQETYPAQR